MKIGVKFPTEEGFVKPEIVKLRDFVEEIVTEDNLSVLLAILRIRQVVEALERQVMGWIRVNWIGLK